MKNTRNQLFGVVSSIQVVALVVRKALAARFEIEYGSVLDWSVLLGLVVSAAFGAKWLYFKFIWRILKSSIDLNGRWNYVSSYTESYIASFARRDGSASTDRFKLREKGSKGMLQFTQDLDSVKLTGVSSRFADGRLTARTLSIEFNETDSLELIFEVTAYSKARKGSHFSYRQIETMKIVERAPWFLWFKRPTKIDGKFSTVLISEGDLDLAQSIWPGWVPTMGTAEYIRAPKT